MDLLSTVRKEGSRGGRAEFKWEDVKNDAQRENYLGHSLMAPVGRWQKGKDLNWYAKGDQSADAQTEAEKRKEEIRKIKEAEEDARLAALGLPPRNANANLVPLGEGGKMEDAKEEMVEGKGKEKERKKRRHHRSRDRDDRRHKHRRHRSESRDAERHRRHRSESPRDGDRHRRRRSRSRDRDPDRRRDRSRTPVKRREEDDRRRSYVDKDRARSPQRDGKRRNRSRSRSPYHDRRRD